MRGADYWLIADIDNQYLSVQRTVSRRNRMFARLWDRYASGGVEARGCVSKVHGLRSWRERPWLCPIVEDPAFCLPVGPAWMPDCRRERSGSPARVVAHQALVRHSFQAVWLLRSEDAQTVMLRESS